MRSRRELLRLLGAGSAAGMAASAGCFSGRSDDGGVGGGDPVQDRVEVDPDEIVEGGTFRVAMQSAPDSFDYPYSSQAFATILSNLVYEGMVTTGADGAIYAWLAREYEQVDVQDVQLGDYEEYMVEAPVEQTEQGQPFPATDAQVVVQHPDADLANQDAVRVLTVDQASDPVDDGRYGMHFRFDLHEGVRFHDGRELTASDVVASYRRVEGSALSSQLFNSFLDIRADGDYTVHVYAQQPDAAALRELGGWPVYPRDMAELPPGEMDPRRGNAPIGTGPFQFEAYQDPEYARFSRYEDYWFDTERKVWFDGPSSFPNGPVVDEVDVSFVPDPSQRSAAIQSGEIDMTFGLNTSSLNHYRSAEGYRAAATRAAGFDFLQFPVEVPPFDDVRVRRAINHMIPREQIAQDVYSGWESPAWAPLPPLASSAGTTDYERLVEDLRPENAYDRERAESLIDEAGVETPVEVVVETNADDGDRADAADLFVGAMNQSEYFDASLEEVADLNTAVARFTARDFYERGHLVWIGISGGFDPHGFARSVHHPDAFGQCCNFQNIDFQELNRLLESARYGVEVSQDRQLRQERYDEIWRTIVELNGNSYTTHSMNVAVVDDDVVHGFNTYPSTQDIVGYGLYSPVDQQITYVDRG